MLAFRNRANDQVWRDPAIVAEYSRAAELQLAEQAVLDLLEPTLPSMDMLDIGVGGGRTALHFAQRTRRYVGIDYSPEMIAACGARLRSAANIRFAVCDARELDGFAASSFDFILFSYNGIDYMSHLERLDAFAAVARICIRGGYFCFSSHNLRSLEAAKAHPITGSGYAIVNDGVHGGRLETYYVSPDEQLNQLSPWFNEIRVYDIDGERVTLQALGASCDPWLTFLCRAR